MAELFEQLLSFRWRDVEFPVSDMRMEIAHDLVGLQGRMEEALSNAILALALLAIDDPSALPVLGDCVQEERWFDPRVMQVVWKRARYPRNGFRTQRKRDKAKLDREAWKLGFPDMFAAFSAAPSANWARAIAAVLLFGGWSTRMWPLVKSLRARLLRAGRPTAAQAALLADALLRRT